MSGPHFPQVAEMSRLRERLAELEEVNSQLRVRTAQLQDRNDMLQTRVDELHVNQTRAHSLEQLDTFLRTAPHGICVLDAELRFIHMNDTLAAMGGGTPEDFVGRTVDEVDSNVARQVRDEFHQVVQQGQSTSKVVVWKQADSDSETSSFRISLHPMFSSSGEVCAVGGIVHDITEQTQAEAALRRSESYLRRIVETSREGVWIVDSEANTTFVSDRLARMLGRASGELLGRRLFDFIVGEEGAAEPIEWDLSVGAEHRECGLLCKDGGVRWVSVTTNPLQEDQQLTGALAMIGDLSQNKRVERTLRRGERLQAAIKQLGCVAVRETNLLVLIEETVRRVGEVLELDFVMALELSSDGEELRVVARTGWGGLAPIDPCMPVLANDQFGYTLTTDSAVVVDDLREETRFDGGELHQTHGVISGVSAAIQSAGRAHGVLAAHSRDQRAFDEGDVAFLQYAAALLAAAMCRESPDAAPRLAQCAFDKVGEPMLTIAEDGRLLDANEMACRQWKRSRSGLLSGNVADLAENLSPKEWSDAWANARDEKQFSVELRSAGGPTLTLHAYLFQFEDGEYACAMARDSDVELPQRQAERRAEKKAAQSQAKNGSPPDSGRGEVRPDKPPMEEAGYTREELGREVAARTFELRTTLQRVEAELAASQRGYSAEELRQEVAARTADLRAALERTEAKRAALRETSAGVEDTLRRLTESMRRSQSRQEVHIQDVIDAALVQLDAECKAAGVEVNTERQENCLVVCDTELIEIVVENLLRNAVEAMAAATEPRVLTVRTAVSQTGNLLVSVSDSGPGFDAIGPRECFEPLVTGKPGGAGIGLTVCRAIVEEHGGRIWAARHAEGGATVSFSLPTGSRPDEDPPGDVSD